MREQMNTPFHSLLRTAAGPLFGVLTAAAVMLCMAVPVMAAEFVMPVTQTMDVLGGRTAPTNDVSITYTLTAENGAPMPKDASGSDYTFSLAGNEQAQLAFHYDEAGDYSYVLERTGITGSGGGMIDGDPQKVRIVNTVNTEGYKVTMEVTILEATYNVGKKMTDCSFDYKCALKLITVTPEPSVIPANEVGQDGASGDSGDGNGNGNGNGTGGSGAGGDGNGANGAGTATASNVKTGDESNAAPYFVMLIAAMAVVTVLTRSRRSR